MNTRANKIDAFKLFKDNVYSITNITKGSKYSEIVN